MKYFMIILMSLVSLPFFGQEKVLFFKTKDMLKEVSENKAKFSYSIKQEGELIEKTLFDLTSNCIITFQKFDAKNKAVGIWEYYNPDCSLKCKVDFSELKYASHQPVQNVSSLIKKNETDSIEFPVFGNGPEDLFKYVSNNTKLPTQTFTGKISGKVYVSFVILADGSVTNVFVMRGVDPFMDIEAIRVVSNMPKWSPGTENGKPVNVLYNMPILFR